MLIHILSPLWGHEHLAMPVFLKKISDAGYDGIDTWIPDDKKDRKVLFDYLQTTGKVMVAHQHAASGSTFQAFKRSFLKNLRQCAEPSPLLINSHTGRDYFSFAQNLELIDIAHDFSVKTGIPVLHETHRGRLGYSPQMLDGFFSVRSALPITADFSHWVCVTESMLENFSGTLKEAIDRTRHIHPRVGYEEGPQISDPRAPEWAYALDHFLVWWDAIVDVNRSAGRDALTITTEFGPAPYMPLMPYRKTPVADQFAVNCFMKDLLRKRYARL